jgi:thiol-disulfide isomerase/thioredoxin
MTRWLVVAALAVVLAFGLAVRADKVADSKAARAFGDLQAQFDKELKKAGRDQKHRQAIFQKYAVKFLEHAKANPKDDSAAFALEVVLQLFTPEDKVKARAEAVELLKKEYVKNKQIRPVLRTLTIMGNGVGGDPALLEIVKAVAKDNPDKLTRATALDELASGLEFRVITAENLSRNESLLSSYEKRYGEDVVKRFLDSTDDSKKLAEGLRKTLKSDYAGVLASTDDPTDEDLKGVLKVGVKAPEIACVDVDGKPVKLADLAGKVVVLDFWATWCGPCRAMIPHTREQVKKYQNKPFVFVSVSCDAERETLLDFVNKNDMPWSNWWDGQGGKVARAYEVRAFPTIYVVDGKGVIQFKSVGYDKKMDDVIEKLIKEAEAKK